jgi:UDP-N-acetylmuramoyl-tripeptide--D-alanyl-D-alanine ligase
MAVDSIEALYEIFARSKNLTTDSRQVAPGDLFFALKGPSFNGNAFARQALEKGAALAVVDEAEYYDPAQMMLVANVLTTLQALAKHHREQLNIPVVAITGSNGKTTTKELLHAVLSTKYRTATTVGNLNNHIGIPLTLLRIAESAEIAVVEMGANHQKEIEAYCNYTLPTAGTITNCGKAHLEGFGGVEGVRKGKGELFDYLRHTGGQAFVCADFDYFEPMAEGLNNPIWYGTKGGSVTGKVLSNEPFVAAEITHHSGAGVLQSVRVQTQLVGSFNLYNVLAAAAIGSHFGVSLAQIAKAIEDYAPSNSRSQLLLHQGNTIVLDAYNANPTSMAAAIQNFAGANYANKIVFVGGMMELGEESLSEHANTVALLQQTAWKAVVLVGGHFAQVAHNYLYFDTADAAADWWRANFETGQTLLIKGSRSMQMEKVLG